MAAVTENAARSVDYWGNHGLEIVDITIANTGDTIVSEFASVQAAWFEPTTAVDHGITISGKTLTFVVDAGMTGKVFILSDPT